jgi:hypothetical protein
MAVTPWRKSRITLHTFNLDNKSFTTTMPFACRFATRGVTSAKLKHQIKQACTAAFKNPTKLRAGGLQIPPAS